MLQDYFPLFLHLAFALALALIVLLLGAIFGPKRPTTKKSAPYESGMVPYGPGTRRMSVRYYLIAVLFILFDVETIFFIPWAVVLRELGWAGIIEMLLFVGILMVGFVYAWKKGALEWE